MERRPVDQSRMTKKRVAKRATRFTSARISEKTLKRVSARVSITPTLDSSPLMATNKMAGGA